MSDDYPVCGPQVKRPLRVRVLRLASVILAFAGLVLLYLYSINRDIPVVKVSDIAPTMNFAYVRIAGEVTRDAYVFKSGGFIFNIDDGSGEIAVMGGRAQADALDADGRLPRHGDYVEVTGSLSVSADQEVRLRMQSADQLVLRRQRQASTASARVCLADITADQQGAAVTVSGVLKTIDIPPPGSKAPYVLMLEEDGEERPVVFWNDVFQALEKKFPMPGKRLRVRGRVDVYKGSVQIKVWDAADIQEVDGEASDESPAVTSIAKIRAEQKGDVFTVIGTLGEPRSIPGGVIYPIADESGEMVVLFWDKQVSGEERDALESGVRLRVTAPLEVYKGTLELIPENAAAFRVEDAK